MSYSTRPGANDAFKIASMVNGQRVPRAAPTSIQARPSGAYTPRAGGVAARTLALLQTRGGGMTSREIADALGATAPSISVLLKEAVTNGLLVCHPGRGGQTSTYSLPGAPSGPASPPPPPQQQQQHAPAATSEDVRTASAADAASGADLSDEDFLDIDIAALASAKAAPVGVPTPVAAPAAAVPATVPMISGDALLLAALQCIAERAPERGGLIGDAGRMAHAFVVRLVDALKRGEGGAL